MLSCNHFVNNILLFLDSNVFFQQSPGSKSSSTSSQSASSTTGNGRTDSSDSEYDERGRSSPQALRKRKARQKKRSGANSDRNTLTPGSNDSDVLDELAYVDTLPEASKQIFVEGKQWSLNATFLF